MRPDTDLVTSGTSGSGAERASQSLESLQPLQCLQCLQSQLRAATSAAHERLDGMVGHGTSLTRSRATYVAFLRASLAVVGPLESALVSHGFASAGRDAAIVADLTRLGAELPFRFEGLSPRLPSSRAEAFGAAYVLEGSALGGLRLARIVEAAGAFDTSATSFLNLRGAGTGPHWQTFLRSLERWGSAADVEERARAVRAAVNVFDDYIAAFQRAGLGGERA